MKYLKKIGIAVSIPIMIFIISWCIFVTKQSFSAQQTEVVLENHKIEVAKEEIYIRDQFKGLNKKVDGINSKIDTLIGAL